MINSSSWGWMIYYVLLRSNRSWGMKGVRKRQGEQGCPNTGSWGVVNASLVLWGQRSAGASRHIQTRGCSRAQKGTRGHLQEWHQRSSTKVTAWLRASPSSWGWTLELSHPEMGFNVVPILAVLRDIWATWFGTGEWQRHNFPKRSVGELGRGLGTAEEMFSPTSLR